MATVSGLYWTAEYGEIGERLQFRIGYNGASSSDVYLPIAQLADLISVLTNVNSLGIGVLSLGSNLQSRKADAGHRTDVVIEPRSDQFPPQLMRFSLDSLSDLITTLSGLQAMIGQSSPADWDDTRPYAITYANLPDALSPEGLSRTIDAATDGKFVAVAGEPIDPRQYGAKFDGVTDDTAALRAAIAALPAAGGHLLLRRGVALTKTLYITGKTRLTITFDDAWLKASPTSEGTASNVGLVLSINNSTDVRVVNARIDGNRANIASVASGTQGHGQQVGLRIANSLRARIENPTIIETVHDAIQLDNCQNPTVTNPTLQNIGESGIYIHSKCKVVSIVGGTYNNIGMYESWGNAIQVRVDCDVISVVGGAADTVYGGLAFTQGIKNVTVSGFVGRNMGIPYSINMAGTVNALNENIRLIACDFSARSGASTFYATEVRAFEIVSCRFDGWAHWLAGFDRLVNCVVENFAPGQGIAAVEMSRAKSEVIGCLIRNVTGRGVNVMGSGGAIRDTTFDTLSDLAIRIQAAATGLRRSNLRFAGVTGGPVFDSANDSVVALTGRGAVAASTVGSVTRKIEVFDESGNSLGFVPVYGSIS